VAIYRQGFQYTCLARIVNSHKDVDLSQVFQFKAANSSKGMNGEALKVFLAHEPSDLFELS
jgi:hypothetical protein